MEIVFKKNSNNVRNELFNALFNQIYHLDTNGNVDNFCTLFSKILRLAKKIYGYDLEKMSDYDLTRFIEENYEIKVSFDEYLDIYSETNGKKYYYYPALKTNTYGQIPVFSGEKCIGSPWVLTPVKIAYKVLIDKDFPFDFNKEYTNDEIRQLAKSKDIVLLNIVYEPIEDKVNQDELDFIDTMLFRTYPFESCHSLVSDYFKSFIARVRQVLTNKRKLEDVRGILLTFKSEMDSFLQEQSYLSAQNDIVQGVKERIKETDDYTELEDIIEKSAVYLKEGNH